MIRSSGLLYTDKQGKEVREDSTVLFELSANDADTHQYVANCVPPHWHDELEIFWLMEGRVRVGIGEETHELQAGEGCLINAGVLHSVTGAVQEACRFRSFVFDASIVSGMPGGVFDGKYIRPLIEKGPTFLRLDLAGADAACLRAFQCAFDACEKEEPGFEFRVREALTEILLNVLKKCRLEPTRARPDAGEKRLKQMLAWMDAHGCDRLKAATRIMITPLGYEFRIVRNIVTNFHQPKSTLLLLVSAFVGEEWRNIYDYALDHGFRFLSYGDSSVLLRE